MRLITMRMLAAVSMAAMTNAAPAWAQELPAGAVLIGEGYSFPEGPAIDKEGTLFFSDARGNTISKWSGGKAEVVLNDTQAGNGTAFDKQGNLYICQGGGQAILKMTPDGNATQWVTTADGGKTLNRPNDAVFDLEGNFFFTNPAKGVGETPVGVVRVRPDGTAMTVATDQQYPNGIDISPDGKTLYVNDFSGPGVIWKYAIAPGGELGKGEIFVQLGGGGPDGIAVAASGNVYAVLNMASKIAVIAPDGKVAREIPFPKGSGVTNLCFGGPDFKTMFVTVGMKGAVYKMPVDEPGMKLYSHR